MRIDTTTEPGGPARPNEDLVCVAAPASGAGGSLVLLDGVTPPAAGTGCAHGVPWFVARLGGALAELSASRRDMTLRECLAGAVARTAAAHRDTCDLSHPFTPQSTVVAVRWDDESVEHLVLSDSVLLVEDAAGTVRPVLDGRLGRLPEPVPSLRAELRRLERGSQAHRTVREKYRIAVESLRNAPDGFFTAAADPSVADRAVAGSRPRGGVRAVAALSDGAARLVDVFRQEDWQGAFRLMERDGCARLIARVREAESADPDCARFPRGKAHDDATAVLVRL